MFVELDAHDRAGNKGCNCEFHHCLYCDCFISVIHPPKIAAFKRLNFLPVDFASLEIFRSDWLAEAFQAEINDLKRR